MVTMLANLKSMVAYDEWATEMLLDAAAALAEEPYAKNLGSSHGGVHGTLVHIYAADRIWLDRWKGSSAATLLKASEIPTLASLRQRWASLRAEQSSFLAALTEERLLEPLQYRDTKGNSYEQPLYQLTQHLLHHSMYHRGQVATLLRQLGVHPPATDLIVFYRETGL